MKNNDVPLSGSGSGRTRGKMQFAFLLGVMQILRRVFLLCP